MTQGAPAPRARGAAHVLLAFDLGYEVDLAKAALRLGSVRAGEVFRHKRGAPGEPAERRWPLRFTRPTTPLAVGGLRTTSELEFALYPFGGVSVGFTLPLDLAATELVATSVALYDNAELQQAARREAQVVLATLGDAVREPALAQAVEDYVVYCLDPAGFPPALELRERELLARILRAESAALSRQEIENALDGRIAYGPEELVVVDWFAALLIGRGLEDERAVLELATVELVELRFLDGRLERRLDEAYGLLTRARRPLSWLSPATHEVERLARFQADSAILHENFDNALKLLGDDYLARLYELCSDRFHFAAWDLSIERKLGTLESIYSKLSDLAARRRAELLEWIIILLFVIDIVLIFRPGKG